MKGSIKKYKMVKAIELAAFFVLELILLIIVISNRTMRTSIFVDKSLFILCAVIYFTVIFALFTLLIDFNYIRSLKIKEHELENCTYIDNKTGIPNRTSCEQMFAKFSTPESLKGVGCMVFELSNLVTINKEYGKEAGDRALKEYSTILENASREYGFVGRNSGNQFVAVVENCDMHKMQKYEEAVVLAFQRYNAGVTDGIKLNNHYEYLINDFVNASSLSDLLSKTCEKLMK